MNSPELLLLVENCPKGAETLVTRCLHILTDKGKNTSLFICTGGQHKVQQNIEQQHGK